MILRHEFGSTTEPETVSDVRRRRMESVLVPLQGLNEFTGDQAKACCDASPGYVTRTLRTLVRAGELREIHSGRSIRYRWNDAAAFRPYQFIDRVIHAGQVKETPEDERPREKLIRVGASSLTTAELLAILIRVGVPGESAIEGGRKVANRFAGQLDKLPRIARSELKSISRATSVTSYAAIMAGVELGRRVAAATADRTEVPTKITSTAEAIEYCGSTFARLAIDGVQEEFHIVTLDTKHKPIGTHRITVGTLDSSLVHPREVFRPAIADASSAILLVHNHPSGDPTPSREDHQVTDRLTQAGKLLGINVLDHVVVAAERCVSLRELG